MRMTTGNEPIRMTAAWSALIIFGGVTLLAFVGTFVQAVTLHSGWGIVVVTGGLFIWTFAWWQAFLLEIKDGVLTYKKLLSPLAVIRIEDIQSADSGFVFLPQDHRPPYRLRICGVSDGVPVDFAVNLKVFKLSDVRALLSMLEASKTNRAHSPH